jgi:hypothetical protein
MFRGFSFGKTEVMGCGQQLGILQKKTDNNTASVHTRTLKTLNY